MAPTARGAELAESLLVPLKKIHGVLNEQFNFDPKTSRRVFSLRISDYLVGWLLPSLLARIRSEAPRVALAVSHHHSLDSLDPDTDMHLLICSNLVPKQGGKRERLFKDKFVVVFRKGHPAANRRMTLKLFLELPHMKVAHAKSGSTILDDALANRGLSRRIAAVLPSYSGIHSIMENSDLCAVLPPSWLKTHGSPSDFSISTMPISGFEFTVDMFTSGTQRQDAGLEWLRKLIQEEFHSLRSAAAGLPDAPASSRRRN
jgi:DNA-binding transcriptional LysR family regulator